MGHRQIGYIGDASDFLAPHVFADADMAGCSDTQRSTSGAHLSIMGDHSDFPIMGRSVRQGAVSSSTPEAELVAGHHAVKNVLIPALDMWDALLPKYCGQFHGDNTAMIRVVQTNRNPTMKQLGRVHGVSIAFLHETLADPESTCRCDLVY